MRCIQRRICYGCGAERFVKVAAGTGSRGNGARDIFCKDCRIERSRLTKKERACLIWKKFTDYDKQRYKAVKYMLEREKYWQEHGDSA